MRKSDGEGSRPSPEEDVHPRAKPFKNLCQGGKQMRSIFVIIGLCFFATGILEAQEKKAGWVYHKIDDHLHPSSDSVSLEGKFLEAPRRKPDNQPRLVIYCQDGKLKDALIIVDAILEEHGLDVRVDGEKTKKVRTFITYDFMALTVPRPELIQVLEGRSAILGAFEFLGGEVTMQFDIPDPTPVQEVCNKEKSIQQLKKVAK